MISIARTHSRNVTNWQNGTMALRWCAAGMVEAGKQFRRVNAPGRGARNLNLLRLSGCAELEPRDALPASACEGSSPMTSSSQPFTARGDRSQRAANAAI
jgi:hypothetical protein